MRSHVGRMKILADEGYDCHALNLTQSGKPLHVVRVANESDSRIRVLVEQTVRDGGSLSRWK